MKRTVTSQQIMNQIRAAIVSFEPVPPPSLNVALFPNPDPAITDMMYELDLHKTLPELAKIFQPHGRRILIVPAQRLEEIAKALRDNGWDVLIEPIMGGSNERGDRPEK